MVLAVLAGDFQLILFYLGKLETLNSQGTFSMMLLYMYLRENACYSPQWSSS